MTEELVADLVLEGGGVKGIGLVGAISVLEERGYRINRVAGTSAGSIVGALVAAGYTGKEMHDVMMALDYTRFRDGGVVDHLGPFGQGLSILFEHGIYEGAYVKQWLRDLLAAKKVATFADLKLVDLGSTLPPEQQYRFVAMTADISQGCLRRLPWDYHHYDVKADDAAVVDAVRASMSIPFFYEPVKFKSAGKDCWLVDGGMLSNFPIETFDRTSGAPRWPTFGIKLSARRDAPLGAVNDVPGTLSMAKAMMDTMMSFHDPMHLDDPTVVVRTIFVDTFKVRATDFDLSPETQAALYQSGRDAATKFLSTWNWDAYLALRAQQDAGAAP